MFVIRKGVRAMLLSADGSSNSNKGEKGTFNKRESVPLRRTLRATELVTAKISLPSTNEINSK